MAAVRPLSAVRGGRRRSQNTSTFAVVRPFWAEELNSLTQTLLAPSIPQACGRGPLPVDLVLYYAQGGSDSAAGSGGKTVDTVLQGVAAKLGQDSCYRKVLVKYAGIGREVAYPASPCTQFVEMFDTGAAPFWGYKAIYLMEFDIEPVRAGWLDQIVPLMEEAARGKAWVIGGIYNLHCMVTGDGRTLWQKKLDEGAHPGSLAYGTEWWNDRHINGNAIYSSDPTFVRWVRANWGRRSGGPGAATDRCKRQGGYDMAMSLEARGMPGGFSRWREDARFMDCKTVGVHNIARTMDASQIRSHFPYAQLVHSTRIAHRRSFIILLKQ